MPSISQMSIKLDGIGHALSDNYLAVPVYQRSYAWEEKHVRDLLQDIQTAISEHEKEYFIGSIVIAQNENSRPEVVDGQQRLATTTILLAAIRDYFFNNQDINRADDVERKYLSTRDIRTQEPMSRFKLNESDNDFFLKKVLSRPNSALRQVRPIKESHNRILKASEICSSHIKSIVEVSSKPEERLLDWIDYLDTRVKIIWVLVPDYTNAFTIFETLNDRGLDLAISDLLKNFLFGMSDDRLSEVQERWVSMFSSLEAVDSESIVVTYIRHLWSSKNGLIREKDLYNAIKKRITSKQASIDFASELFEGSRLYVAILNTENELWARYGATARLHMSTINLLGMIQIRPLLLAVLANLDATQVKKSIKLMVSRSVRFLIVGGLGGGTLESYYSNTAKEVRAGNIKNTKNLIDAMKGVVPADSEFEAAFSNAQVSKNYLARYYLRALENGLRGQDEPELIPNPNEEIITLEHILPLNPSSEWSHFDEEAVRLYSKRIGNLTLLAQKPNDEAGNDGFQIKREIYRKSDYKITSGIYEFSDWNEESIERRQKFLAELAVKVWPIKI